MVLFEPNATSTGTNETSNTVKHTSVKSATLWRLENHQEEKWLFAQVENVYITLFCINQNRCCNFRFHLSLLLEDTSAL